MARRKSGATEAPNVITVPADSNGYTVKRERAQTVNFAKIKEIMQRNVARGYNKTFAQYTKDLIKTYVQSPNANQDTLREISRFLCRNSMIYQKLIMYYASMPLFHYNITQINDLSKAISAEKASKNYAKVLERFHQFNLKKEGYTALFLAIRDGAYVGYMYDSGSDGLFLMPLDLKYIRIYGKTDSGEWIVYFNAAYFSQGNNSEFVEGIGGDMTGAWDDVFIDGWKAYQADKQNAQWFRLPSEKTCVLLTGSEDEFMYPLPFFLPLFTDILDLLDLQQILQSKTELENYKLIISKIPLIEKGNSGEVDDFAISLELAEMFNELMLNAVPPQIGVVYSPLEVETVDFENSNNTSDTNELTKSIQNLFSNAGASQVAVSGGASTSSIAIKYAQLNDQANTWVWVDRLQSWLNYFIKMNISKGYYFKIHQITWYNRDEYVAMQKDGATTGDSALEYLTAKNGDPYMAIQQLRFENALGIKDLMIPLKTSYTLTGDEERGRPTVPDDEISDSGDRSRNE